MPSRILGISAHYHDGAAALVVDGRIAAAAQEERVTRKKHDPAFPTWRSAIASIRPGSYFGPDYSQSEIETQLTRAGAQFSVLEDQDLIATTVQPVMDEKAIGWFQGRMEFGPRALGARSIFGDPRSASMQKSLNSRVKYRESFRPFAPAILRIQTVHADNQPAFSRAAQGIQGADRLPGAGQHQF